MEDIKDQGNAIADASRENTAADMSEMQGDEATLTRCEAELVETLLKYQRARHNLGIMIVLTAINIAFVVFKAKLQFPFSAFVPYLLVGFGAASEGSGAFGYVVASAIMAMFVVCWLFCTVRPWWMVLALVMFVLDTVTMGVLSIMCVSADAGLSVSFIIDAVFHIWVLNYLFKGAFAGFKFRKLLKMAVKETEGTRAERPQEES